MDEFDLRKGCLLLLLSLPELLFGQAGLTPVYIFDSKTPESVSLNTFLTYYQQPSRKMALEDVASHLFQSLEGNPTLKIDKYPVWVRIRLTNHTPDTIFRILNPGNHLHMTIWEENNKQKFENGRTIPWANRASKIYFSYFPISLAPCDTNSYLIRNDNFFKSSRKIDLKIHTETYSVKKIADRIINLSIDFYSSVAVTSITFFLFLFTITQFIKLRKKIYITYALYLLSMFFLLLKDLENFGVTQVLFRYAGIYHLHLETIFDLAPFFLYGTFVSSILDLKNQAPDKHRYLVRMLWTMWGLLGINVLLYPLELYQLANYWFLSLQALVSIVGVWLIWILLQNLTNPSAKYILLGTSFLLVGALVSITFAQLKHIYGAHIFENHILIMRIGFLLEILCFSYVLGLRMGSQILNLELEQEKAKRTLLKTELKALRAQMNPHFVFNCLNSIKALIQEDRSDEAIDYLIQFSKLIRFIVENSHSMEASLREEISFSRLYLDLESLRLGHNFTYQIKWDDSTIDLDHFLVPPFLFQPFLENAAWHGFRRKGKEKNELSIIIEERSEGLCCVIEDNGIGRKNAEQRKSTSTRSVGINNVKERIEILNKVYDSEIKVTIIDQYDFQGMAKGTKVELLLPY